MPNHPRTLCHPVDDHDTFIDENLGRSSTKHRDAILRRAYMLDDMDGRVRHTRQSVDIVLQGEPDLEDLDLVGSALDEEWEED